MCPKRTYDKPEPSHSGIKKEEKEEDVQQWETVERNKKESKKSIKNSKQVIWATTHTKLDWQRQEEKIKKKINFKFDIN